MRSEVVSRRYAVTLTEGAAGSRTWKSCRAGQDVGARGLKEPLVGDSLAVEGHPAKATWTWCLAASARCLCLHLQLLTTAFKV